MTPETILQRSDNVAFEKVDEEAVLIDLTTGTYFSLNKVGTQFWEMLDGRQSIAAHAAAIAAQYNVDAAMVTGDLLEVAGKLAADNLVTSL